MKIGITKNELPIVVDRMRRYTGGLIAGIGLGMFFATRYFPEADRQLLPSRFFHIAFACLLGGLCLASFSWQKRPRKHSVDEVHVA